MFDYRSQVGIKNRFHQAPPGVAAILFRAGQRARSGGSSVSHTAGGVDECGLGVAMTTLVPLRTLWQVPGSPLASQLAGPKRHCWIKWSSAFYCRAPVVAPTGIGTVGRCFLGSTPAITMALRKASIFSTLTTIRLAPTSPNRVDLIIGRRDGAFWIHHGVIG